MSNPSVYIYSCWQPKYYPYTVSFSGDPEIYDLFKADFASYDIGALWSPGQEMYEYAFRINNGSILDKAKFDRWFENHFKVRPFPLKCAQFDAVWALGYHFGKLQKVVRSAKPYPGDQITDNTYASANDLVRGMVKYFGTEPWFRETEFLVPVPCEASKSFDLPSYITGQISAITRIPNASEFVSVMRQKQHSQKDLETKEEKRANVNGLFGISNNHPFSGKTVTIVDDIYRSGSTMTEFARVLRLAGAVVIQGVVATKTIRD